MKEMLYFTILLTIVCITGNQVCSEEIGLKEDCSKEELMMFFPKTIVKNVLINQAHLSQENAEKIARKLALKDKILAKLIDEKASQYNPNPFKVPNQKDQAIKIYQETVFEEFAEVLKANGFEDKQQIKKLLEEIRFTKSNLFIKCIRSQQLSVEKK